MFLALLTVDNPLSIQNVLLTIWHKAIIGEIQGLYNRDDSDDIVMQRHTYIIMAEYTINVPRKHGPLWDIDITGTKQLAPGTRMYTYVDAQLQHALIDGYRTTTLSSNSQHHNVTLCLSLNGNYTVQHWSFTEPSYA